MAALVWDVAPYEKYYKEKKGKTAPAAQIPQPICHFIVLSLNYKNPGYLNSFTWGKYSFPTSPNVLKPKI